MAQAAGESILIFRTPDDEWGEFSNQYPAPFTYMGTRFETVEQFLYYMKAVFGRSMATAEKILACGGDPSALSRVSKKQRVLETNSWETVRPQIMRIGMRQKFLQNPELRRKLLGTGFRLLVEIPKEGLLGRLFSGGEDWVRDPGKWKGRNLTGKTLMQVRSDLRCADRLVGPDEAYVFPEEPFILRTPAGQMTLQEISMLPGARESVRAYAETAQQYMQLFLATADDYIKRNSIPLAAMERVIARNAKDIELAISRSRARAEEENENAAENAADNTGAGTVPETEEEHGADAVLSSEQSMETRPELIFGGGDGTETQPVILPEEEPRTETQPAVLPETGSGTEAEDAASPGEEPAAQTQAVMNTLPESQPEDPGEDLPDDIPAEGFYELLYDLDELMKLGVI